jgi:ribonuclease P protein component
MSGKNSAASSNLPPARPPLARRGRKANRLLKHADFQRVYQNGRRQFTGNITVFFLRRPPQTAAASGLRVGLTVGKVLGGAVERNRIKRRMREAVRRSLAGCEGPVDVVFNPRKSVLELPFSELLSEVARALKLAEQRARLAEAEK